MSFGHAALGVFDHDDGIIHQHADGKDQTEQHNKVYRQTRHLQTQDAHQEARRNGQPDQNG